MAQDVISTLFGITPRNAAFDQYAQEQMIDVNKAGSQYADLGRANIERASAMMQNAGTGLGIGIGRLLGGQTPQMAEEQRVQGMLGGASLQDPEQLMMAAERFAQAGDIPRAQALAGQAQALKTRQEEQARAKETQQADLLKKQADADKVRYEMEMKQVAYQNRFAALKAKFPELSDAEARGIAMSDTSFNEVIKTPKVDTQVVEVDGQQVLFNKKTGERIAVLGKASDKRTTVNVSPTIKMGSGVVDLLQGTQDLTKAELAMKDSAETAKRLINQASTSGNSQSWEAARTQIAKAVGEGKLSNEDIRRTGVDPRLIQGALDWVNKKVEGVPNQDIMKQLYAVATILEQTSTQRINKKMNAARTVATKESGLTEETAGTLFPDVDASTGAVEWSRLPK